MKNEFILYIFDTVIISQMQVARSTNSCVLHDPPVMNGTVVLLPILFVRTLIIAPRSRCSDIAD